MSEALLAGIGEGRLRGRDLLRPFRGVRSAIPVEPARAYAPLLREGDRFSHATAALLWPLPLPRLPDGLHVTAISPRNAPRRPGVVGHTASIDDSVLRSGLPVTAPARLFLELSGMLALDDLVAIGDALLHDPPVFDPADPRPWLTMDELAIAVRSFHGRGARQAAAALPLIRTAAESRPESLLRLLILRAGLPEPALNVDVRDSRGRWIGRFDMVYHGHRVIVEYDGDQHRSDRRQYEKDEIRLEAARLEGWRVVRVRARGLFVTPDATAALIRQTLAPHPFFPRETPRTDPNARRKAGSGSVGGRRAAAEDIAWT